MHRVSKRICCNIYINDYVLLAYAERTVSTCGCCSQSSFLYGQRREKTFHYRMAAIPEGYLSEIPNFETFSATGNYQGIRTWCKLHQHQRVSQSCPLYVTFDSTLNSHPNHSKQGYILCNSSSRSCKSNTNWLPVCLSTVIESILQKFEFLTHFVSATNPGLEKAKSTNH